jgi:hypothetical protein
MSCTTQHAQYVGRKNPYAQVHLQALCGLFNSTLKFNQQGVLFFLKKHLKIITLQRNILFLPVSVVAGKYSVLKME